jgi:DNA-binding MarR family transcriptional regulator
MLTELEFSVLRNIDDGNNKLDELSLFTELGIENVKKILTKLEKLELIRITKNFDTNLMREIWHALTTEKARGLLNGRG